VKYTGIIAALALAVAIPAGAQQALPFTEYFNVVDFAGLDARGWTTNENSDMSISGTTHTADGSGSLYDADDVTNLARWIETWWSPEPPGTGESFIINWWWMHDSTGSSSQHDCKEVNLWNNGGGAGGSARVRWGPYTFGRGALYAALVTTNAWANLDANGMNECYNIYNRNGNTWQQWEVKITTGNAFFTVAGADYLACIAYSNPISSSGPPSTDLQTYPINRIWIGVDDNWGNRRGIFWFDDLVVQGNVAVDDWAAY
jgi:hypothetical protein